MVAAHIDASLLKVFMTSTGYVALCSNQLEDSMEAALFGSDGRLAPRPITALVDDMLADLERTPQASDADDLHHLTSQLKASLASVEHALGRL